MASQTPWISQKPKGYLASDRLGSNNGAPTKGASTVGQQHKQKSPEVTRLHKLISRLQDPKIAANESDEGCFCLAQVHTLSPYVSLCMSCGLILCELNQPYRNCPYKQCGQPLLSPQSRTALIKSLENKVATIAAEEEQARRREREEQRKAEGAFPQLGPASSRGPSPRHSPAPTHKVLSLTPKGAVLTTVRKSTPPPACPVKEEAPVQKIRPPPPEPTHFAAEKVMGPWQSLRAERLIYIPPPKAQNSSRAKKRQKKQPLPKGEQVEQEIGDAGN